MGGSSGLRSRSAPLRLARNALWSVAPLSSAGSWTVEVSLPDENTLALAHEQNGTIHTRAFLEFMLRCPGAVIRCLILRKNGSSQGYAVLSTVSGQARIADLRIASPDQNDWNAAVSSLVRSVSKDTANSEIAAIATTPLLEHALQANGFHVRERRPLVVLDSAGDMTTQPVPQLGMLVDDAAFLSHADTPYLT